MSCIAVAGSRRSVIAVAATVCGFVSAVLVPWLLDFSDEDHSSYVALF